MIKIYWIWVCNKTKNVDPDPSALNMSYTVFACCSKVGFVIMICTPTESTLLNVDPDKDFWTESEVSLSKNNCCVYV